MEESWRVRMRMPGTSLQKHHTTNYLRRKSTEDSYSRRRNPISVTANADDSLSPEDFRDVFGGPPRTVLSRHFSSACQRSCSGGFFYEEIFQPPEMYPPASSRNGRSLPGFKIPVNNNNVKREIDEFYDDIFGWENEKLVRTRSKEVSSSMMSSEEHLSPFRPAEGNGAHNEDVSRFGTYLRPINVKAQQSFAGKQPTPGDKKDYPFAFCRKNASPETISLEPMSNCSLRISADDLEAISPLSSAVSSVSHSTEKQQKVQEMKEQEDDIEDIMSCYTIEINSDNRGGTSEPNGVDEAIAWAKEKFQTRSPESDKPKELSVSKKYQVSEGNSDSVGSSDEHGDIKWAAQEQTAQNETLGHREMRMLDEKIRQWSAGKETDIRLLLCTLHHILWPNSGWLAVPIHNLIEIAKVKKAYQRARLCLHPDKLQQRGATPPQKYLAENAFSILQDAWSAFIARAIL